MVMDDIKEEVKDEFVSPKSEPKIKKKRSRKNSETSTASALEEDGDAFLGFRKKKKHSNYNAKEEARLEKLVFGDPSDVFANLKDEIKSEVKEEVDSDDDEDFPTDSGFDGAAEDDSDDNDAAEDDSGDEAGSLELIKSEEESVITVDSKISPNAPAWVDEDDDITLKDALKQQNRTLPSGRTEKTYNELLLNKYACIVGTPKWAQLDKEKADDSADSEDEDVLKHSNHLVPKTTKSLPKDKIDLKVLTNINKQTHIEGPYVNCVQFHEQSTVALVAGSSGTLSLFQVDGRENNKLHSLRFEKFPIHCARFLKEGTEVLVGTVGALGSKRKQLPHYRKLNTNTVACCHSYDLVSGKTLRIPLPHGMVKMQRFELSPDGKILAVVGKFGKIYLLSSVTKELICTMQMNKSCKSLAFSPDGTKLFTYGESAEVYTWDMHSRTCLNRAVDDGAVNGCTLAISSNGQFLATGSKQGVVNLYESKDVISQRVPLPVKSVFNLTTAISKLKFNPTTEILAMASDQKVNALKMLHLPSFTVFPNFPTNNTTMFNPIDIDFSPGGGYMALSNNRGIAYLYRLKHYGNY